MDASAELLNNSLMDDLPDTRLPRVRKRSPSLDADRKRHRPDAHSPDLAPRSRSDHDRPSWEREPYSASRRQPSHYAPPRSSYPSHSSPYEPARANGAAYENGFAPNNPHYHQSAAMKSHTSAQSNRSRRLYVGNIPYHVGLTDVALTQFFSALYVAGFGPNKPGEVLPVVSFWLQADGKFGFVELRGAQETVNMMQFHGVFLHRRPLRINRPSDYRPEMQDPADIYLKPDVVNIQAVLELCDKLGGIAAAPAHLAALAASQTYREGQNGRHTPSQPPSHHSPPSNEPPHHRPPRPAARADDDRGTASEGRSSASEDDVPRVEKKDSPATVIALKDLFKDEDLDGNDADIEELMEEVRDGCEQDGAVESVVIPRNGPYRRTAFVQFKHSSSVKPAVERLREIEFDKRKIVPSVVENCETAAEAAERQPAS